MKPINFINTISPKEQKALETWYTSTLIILALSMVCIVGLQFKQLWSLYTTRTKALTKNLHNNSQLQKYERLQQNHAFLNRQYEQVNKSLEQHHNPCAYLTCIKELLSDHINLQTCTLTDTTISCALCVPHAQAATNCIRHLKKTSYFTGLKLTSMQPHYQGFLAQIQGLLA